VRERRRLTERKIEREGGGREKRPEANSYKRCGDQPPPHHA